LAKAARFCSGGNRLILSAMALLQLSATVAGDSTPAGMGSLKIASWNLEWLLTPDTFRSLKPHCTGDDGERRHTRRQLPCDVARTLERSATDIQAMARYARALDADVVALQEVDGANAARQLFPGYDFCFTGNTALQNTGFAIRRGVPYQCGSDIANLSLGDSVRRGATVTLFPATQREIHLLGVHLKSGCARQPLTGSLDACVKLKQQVPALEAWIESQARAKHRFALMGDFNRDLLATGDVLGSNVHSAASRGDFTNCSVGQRHNGFIDYLLFGDRLFARLQPGSFERLTYAARDAARYKLSDHCPVSVRIQLQ
jgi:endonuclease/exonuclease/phosphatase family metal-dependent hydrolase